MPKFHLNQVYADKRIDDVEGEEFESLEDAKAEAIAAARDIAADQLRNGRAIPRMTMEVASADRVFLTVPFSDLVIIES